jgi:hypothetical protein
MKTIILYFLLVARGITEAQPLLLYDTGNVKGRYLLSRTYEESDNYTVSEIIVCDSFAVKLNGTVCQATISNAFVYLAKVKQDSLLQSTNSVRQYKMFNPKLTVGFLPDTKLIFNNAVMNVADFKPTLANQGGVVTYKGDAVKQEMKKLGLKPPPDADMNK